LGQPLGPDRQFVDAQIPLVEDAHHLGHHKVRHHLRLRVGVAPLRALVQLLEGRLEIVGHGLLLRQHAGVIRRKPHLIDEPLAAGTGQFREGRPDALDHFVVDGDLDEIRIGHVPVVVSLLLRAHGPGGSGLRVPEQGLLSDRIPLFRGGNLTCNFVVERLLDVPHRVHVFELRPRPERLPSARANTDVCVAAERALFHVAVTDAEVPHQLAQPLEEEIRLARRAQIGLRHHLEEGNPAAIEVEPGRILVGVVHGLACILLHVDAGQPDAARFLSVR